MTNQKPKAENENFSIGRVSKTYDISVKTLHYYDKIGLVRPSQRQSQNGYRYYTEDDITRLMVIKYYQESGLSLTAIKNLLASSDMTSLLHSFEEAINQKNEELKDLKVSLDSLLAWKNLLVEGERLRQQDQPILIKKMRPIYTLCEGIATGPARGLRTKSLATGQRCYGAVYREFPSALERYRHKSTFYLRHMEIHPLCFQKVDYFQLGNCICISGVHVGSYETINTTYRKLFSWAKERELSLSGSALERLVVDGTSLLPEENFVTEVLLPLAPPEAIT